MIARTNVANGEFTQASLPARFNEQLRALNPHHQ